MNRTGHIAAKATLCQTALLIAGMGSPIYAGTCPDGASPLPNTQLCPGDAEKLMPPADPLYSESLSLMGCRAVVNDGTMFGNVMLYRGAQCGGAVVALEGSMGARSGGLDVWGGGIHADTLQDPVELAVVLGADPGDPTGAMMRWARASMEADGFSAQEIARCRPRREPRFGPDAWVIDEYDLDAAPMSQDGPRVACGTEGYTEESHAYWRITNGLAMFFNMGQEAYMDIDPSSLTFVERPAGTGAWQPVSGAGGAVPAPTAAPANADVANPTDHIGVTNIAGGVEAFYGQARGWTVYAGSVAGQVTYCVGEIDLDGIKLRLGADNGQWQIALPSFNPDVTIMGLEVDSQTWDVTGTTSGQWAFGRIGIPQLQAIKNGNLMIVDIGRASLDFPLVGTAATILKVEECLARAG